MKVTLLIAWLFISLLFISAEAIAQQQLEFDVYLNEEKIGYYRVNIESTDAEKIVNTEANFKVKFLIFNAYKYKHSAKEKWNNSGCLKAIEAKTKDDGEKKIVSGRKDGHQFKITTLDGSNWVQGCVRSFAYWDLDLIKAPRLLNTQNGDYLDVTTAFIDTESIIVNGKTINADHYQIDSDKMIIDVWYNNKQEWVALSTTVRDDEKLRFERK